MSQNKWKEVSNLLGIHNYFPVITLLMTGIFLTASAIVCSDSEESCKGDGEVLSVALGAINFLLSVLLLFILFKSVNEILSVSLSILLFLLCSITASYVTFVGPHVLVTNGFLSSWLASLASLGNILSNKQVENKVGERITELGIPVVFEIAASLLVLSATLVAIDSCCDEQELLALTGSVVGILAGILRLALGPGRDGAYNTYFGIFLSIWWASIGTFVTFGIFKDIGNGYLGVLVAFLCSIYLLQQANKVTPLF